MLYRSIYIFFFTDKMLIINWLSVFSWPLHSFLLECLLMLLLFIIFHLIESICSLVKLHIIILWFHFAESIGLLTHCINCFLLLINRHLWKWSDIKLSYLWVYLLFFQCCLWSSYIRWWINIFNFPGSVLRPIWRKLTIFFILSFLHLIH